MGPHLFYRRDDCRQNRDDCRNEHLTPVVLELGGKSPAIVHSSANVRVAARRIAHGRWGNAGQTCTAPDYVLVFRDVADQFLEQLKATVLEFYGDDLGRAPPMAALSTGIILTGWWDFGPAVVLSTSAGNTIAATATLRRPGTGERAARCASDAGGDLWTDSFGLDY